MQARRKLICSDADIVLDLVLSIPTMDRARGSLGRRGGKGFFKMLRVVTGVKEKQNKRMCASEVNARGGNKKNVCLALTAAGCEKLIHWRDCFVKCKEKKQRLG